MSDDRFTVQYMDDGELYLRAAHVTEGQVARLVEDWHKMPTTGTATIIIEREGDQS